MRRWMLFVDGENLTIRAQELVNSNHDSLNPQSPAWKKDILVWLPGHHGTQSMIGVASNLEWRAIRAYYYTSLVGTSDDIEAIEATLWAFGFTPRVFKRLKNRDKSKGLDISLATDMLSHAFQDHYDVAILMAGDGDYVPLVEQLKRLGKRVILAFFPEGSGLNTHLRLSADEYFDITGLFMQKWSTQLIKGTNP
jgi:uncharacterized LabA/DUF88 family protein